MHAVIIGDVYTVSKVRNGEGGRDGTKQAAKRRFLRAVPSSSGRLAIFGDICLSLLASVIDASL